MSAAKKASKTRTKAVAKVGRPTAYREEYADLARSFCLLGATDVDLARIFEVSEATISNWKLAHPEFLEALKAGKEEADARVASSLYHRAIGYEHEAVKIVADAKTGAEHQVPYIERYPPETTAAIFWLKNRRPDLWREKSEVTLVSPDVQARVQRMVEVIASRPTWDSPALLTELSPIFQP